LRPKREVSADSLFSQEQSGTECLTLGGTSKVTHPPWYNGVGETPPWIVVMLQYFEKISPLVESL